MTIRKLQVKRVKHAIMKHPGRKNPDGTDSDDKVQLEVLLMHEDLSAGLRAKQALDQVSRRLEPKAELRINLWNFDLVSDPAIQELAVQEAARADIVFLSAVGVWKLPAPVHAWLQQWLVRRRHATCALVVSLDARAQNSVSASRLLDSVRQVAEPAGVDVFPHFGTALPAGWERPLQARLRQADPGPARPEEWLNARDARPRWGINE